MPETVRRECPIAACDWHYDEPGLSAATAWPAVDEAAIADAGGDVVLAIVKADLLRGEAILRGHFETHPLEDWVLEVERLRVENARLAAERSEPAARRRLASMVSVRFDADQLDAVRAAADAAGVSVSAFIRAAALKRATTIPTGVPVVTKVIDMMEAW